MTTGDKYFTDDQIKELVAALAAAEQGNRGEVRVHMVDHVKGDP
jgi:hypothetical protein